MSKIIGIISTVLGVLAALATIIFKMNESRSVSVIGGADGPTAIFLAGKIGAGSVVAGIVTGIVLIVVGVILIRKKNTSK